MIRRSLCVAAFLSLASLSSAQSASLEPAKDNSLYLSGTGGTSNGAGQYLFAGTTGGGSLRRALMQFDVAGSVPAGATITGATLTLQLNKTAAGNLTLGLRRLTQDWGEGASNAPGEEGGGAGSQPGDATWIHTFFNSSFWTNAGGDFSATLSASQVVPFPSGPYSWSSAQLIADVQDMLDNPGNNFGWILFPDSPQTGNAKRFGSRENPNPAQRPRLDITYTSGTPAGVNSVGTGCVGSSGQPYTITNAGLPQLGNGAFAVNASQGPAASSSFLLFASGTGPGLPIISPTCLTHLDFNSAATFLAQGASPLATIGLNASGAGSFGLPIPNNTNLLGTPFAVEAVALDFGVPSLLVASNALDLTFGN